MIALVFFSLVVINGVIVLQHKSSKFIAFLLWLTMFFAYAGNIRTGFSDLPSYRFRYEKGLSSLYFSDPGYNFLADFLGEKGFSFHILLAVIFIIASLCFYIVLKKLNVNYNVVVVLLSLFCFFFMMEALRYLIAFGLAFLGVFLLKDGKIRNRLFYCACVIFGSLFHKSILMIIPFVFVYRVDGLNKRIIKILFFLLGSFTVALIVLNLVTRNSGTYLERFFSLIGEDAISMYKANFYILSQKRVRLGFLYYFVYYFMNLIISYSIISLYEKSGKSKSRFSDIVHQYNIFSMVFLPFIMISTTFFRVILFGAVASFVSLAELMSNKAVLCRWKEKQDYDWACILLAITIWTIIWWYLKINVIGPFEALKQNVFF